VVGRCREQRGRIFDGGSGGDRAGVREEWGGAAEENKDGGGRGGGGGKRGGSMRGRVR